MAAAITALAHLLYTVVGIVDDVTTCECCGRENLKATVALRDEHGEVTYFGRSCATKAAGWTAKELTGRLGAAKVEAERLAQRRRNASQAASQAVIAEWMAATYGTTDAAEANRLAGGFAARSAAMTADGVWEAARAAGDAAAEAVAA